MEDCKGSLVSVIIPTYSRPKYLLRAIDSVLAQTYKNIEIIVVDDNGEYSENQLYTEHILSDLILNDRIIYLKHSVNKNASAARNTGLKASHGRYIAFLDDDDLFLPTKIEKQVEKLKNTSEIVGACYCNWAWYTGDKLIKTNQYLGEGNLLESMLLMENQLSGGSSLLLKRSVCEDLNGFDESFIRQQDWEFMTRFFRKYEIVLANEVLLHIHVEHRIFSNKPEVAEQARIHFLSVYKDDILNCEQANKILMRHYYQLAWGYFNAGDWLHGFRWYKKAYEYNKIGWYDSLRCLYVYFRSFCR